MFDARLRPLINPPLDRCGRWLAARGVHADHVTLASFAAGLCAALCLAAGWFWTAAALIVLNRFGDGVDGAVARAGAVSLRGGFLDITCDFGFYAAVPVAFALHNPGRNALAAAVLLASFLANGSAFLAYAIAAERQRLTTTAQGLKSFFYVAGLAEGAETIAVFILVCLWPNAFPAVAYAFAALCFASAAARVIVGWQTLSTAPLSGKDRNGG
jgi:phosphatidylglycerophosphate synthase